MHIQQRITLRYKNFFWNTQLMSVIIFYVFLVTESDSEISIASSRLDSATYEVTIFGKQQKMKKLFSRNNG